MPGRNGFNPNPVTFRPERRGLCRAFSFAWRPEPIPRPVVPPDLTNLPFLIKSAEVLRYQIRKLEYSISSGGGLRAWFKLNLLVTLLLAIPAFLLFPVITAVLVAFAGWAICLMYIVRSLLMALLYALAIAAIVTTVICLILPSRGKR